MLLAATGLAAWTRPFLRGEQSWAWRLNGPDALRPPATVNAEITSLDERGAELLQRGERPVSVISPPLTLGGRLGPGVRVRASMPAASPANYILLTVNFLWQDRPSPEFHFERRTVELTDRPLDIEFSLPVEASRLHRMGVQFVAASPEGVEPLRRSGIRLESIEFPAMTFSEKCALAVRQAAEREPFLSHSLNFVRGPLILGHGLNYYAAATLALAGGAFAAARRVRRRPITARSAALLFGCVWLALDVQATANLLRQFRADHGEYAQLPPDQQWERMHGAPLNWLRTRLERTSPGSTYAVLSDDPFTAAQRLDYALAPSRIRRERYEEADYIAVIACSDAVWVKGGGFFRRGEGPAVAVAAPAAWSEEVYLLRRVRP